MNVYRGGTGAGAVFWRLFMYGAALYALGVLTSVIPVAPAAQAGATPTPTLAVTLAPTPTPTPFVDGTVVLSCADCPTTVVDFGQATVYADPAACPYVGDLSAVFVSLKTDVASDAGVFLDTPTRRLHLWTTVARFGPGFDVVITEDAPMRLRNETCPGPARCVGAFRPERSGDRPIAGEYGANAWSLGALDGEPGNGAWALTVVDYATGDVIAVRDWAAVIQCRADPPPAPVILPIAVRRR